MNRERLGTVLEQLAQRKLTQMMICDPAAIYYLTGQWIHPTERMLILYLRADGKHKLFVNKLFTVADDPDLELIWFTDTEDGVAQIAKYTDPAAPIGVDKDWPARFLLRMIELHGAASYVNASVCVDRVRACKDQSEQALMRNASRINDLCMTRLQAEVQEGVTELAIAARIPALFAELGAEGVSFAPSVCFGANAAVGHHEPDDTPLHAGDCVLIDMGCVKDGYCSDMTRTFFFGEPLPKHRAVYELVQKANETAEAMIRPGVALCELDLAARNVIEQAGFGEYFTHRLGHSIGFECHEWGDVSGVSAEYAREGMVFSIEPGVYLPGELGVRIEDLMLVTADGCERLNAFPKDLVVLQ